MNLTHWFTGPMGTRLQLLIAGAAAIAAIRAPLPALAAAAIAGTAGVLIVLICARLRAFCDEVIRAAHRTGWLSGTAAGLVAVLTFTVWLQKTAPRDLPGWISGATPNELVVLGMATVVLAQMIGYLIFWTVWWRVKR